MDKQNQSLSWDPVWEKVFSENSWGKYAGESLIQFVARNFYKLNRTEIKILEVGCGPGANIWYLSREGFDAYGIDGSTKAIELAEKRLKNEGLIAHLTVGDIVSLSYPDNFFDAVLDVECLYANDYDNSRKILAEIKRVLKPHGLLYSRTLSDEIFIGNEYDQIGYKSYTNVSEGPLKGRGFARLMDVKDIEELYSDFFNLLSIDELNYTQSNRSFTISEFVILCQKI